METLLGGALIYSFFSFIFYFLFLPSARPRADTAHALHAQQTAALTASESNATAALAAAESETARLCSGTCDRDEAIISTDL